MTSVIAMFEDKGFEIINAPESEHAESTEAAVKSRAASQTEAAAKPANASERELLLRSYVAVSYTHLDVYKRQFQDIKLCRQDSGEAHGRSGTGNHGCGR